jgi:hypothetical protein
MQTIAGQPLVMTFVDASDNPLANGYLTLQLTADAIYTGAQVSAGIKTKIMLDGSGSFSDNNTIPNDSMTPSTTRYFAVAYASDGQKVWSDELYVTGGK